MMRTFWERPEFTDRDVRKHRPPQVAYSVSPEFMTLRHEAMLPADLVQGRSVLDLGCAVAATGAWVLDAGASAYTGVELQAGFCNIAQENLSQYYDRTRWNIVESEIESFVQNFAEHYDIIVISGVLYGIADYFGMLKDMAKITDLMVIENLQPWRLTWADGTPVPLDLQVRMNELPIVQYVPDIAHSDAVGNRSIKYQGTFMSIPALEAVVNHLGWSLDRTPADTLKRTIPELYDAETLSQQTPETTPNAIVYNNMPPRYAVWCRPNTNKQRQDFRQHYSHPEDQREYRTW